MRTLLATVAAVAAARCRAAQARTYGATTLKLDPGAVAALTSLGVAPAPIAPATATSSGELAFPITNPPFAALLSGTIRHSGGIALTAGGDDGQARELLHRPATAAAHRARRRRSACRSWRSTSRAPGSGSAAARCGSAGRRRADRGRRRRARRRVRAPGRHGPARPQARRRDGALPPLLSASGDPAGRPGARPIG